jgi:ABC-type lipoprotein export system ATPase subunit
MTRMDTGSMRPPSRRRRRSETQSLTNDHAMIEMRAVEKTFENAAGKFTALKGIDLVVEQGEFVSIVGKSGSGKSTLLNMITGIDHPSAGQVVVSGTDIYTGVSESQRSRWRGRNLGIVFQFFQLLPMLTLLENVMLPMDFADLYPFEERPSRAAELLKIVGLEEFADTLPTFVSNGQQQLAAIARALACDPPLLVADEPTGNLDHKSAVIIVDLFEHLAEQGKTILMVTHDPSMSSRTTRNIIISDGELIDESIAAAFPWLPDRQLLDLTKGAASQTLEPGEVLLERRQSCDYLYLVKNGELEMTRTTLRKRHTRIGALGPGETYGEVEIMRGEGSQVDLRGARNTAVELLTISAAVFRQAALSTPAAAEQIDRLVREKQAFYKGSKRKTKGKSRD